MREMVKILKRTSIDKINNGYICQTQYEGEKYDEHLTLSFPTLDAVIKHLTKCNIENDLITDLSYRITDLQKRIDELERGKETT